MRNKGIYSFFLLLLFGVCVSVRAHEHWIVLPSAYDQPSFVVNEDSTVSYCYCGPGKRVSVLGDFQYSGKDSTRYNDMRTRKIKMRRASDGCFHVTTKQLVPETYTYCFRVNGKRKPDPNNNDTAWQMIHKWNIVSVGGTPQADLYLQPEIQGQLIQTKWYDRSENIYRRVNVYLPAGYNEVVNDTCPNGKYPVLYLLHGINGYEGSWSERGRVIQIIENLIAGDSIAPMIVVMPDCNTGVHEDRPSHHTLWNNVVHYPRLCRDHSLELALEDLMQYMDTTYRVSNQRYIAGLSSGARIAANIVNRYPDKFQAVGLFSPVVYKEQMPKADIPPFYIYMGKDDMFINNGRRFHKRLTKSGIDHFYLESEGGHTWRNWRLYLSDFLVRVSTRE
ncbi:MAG: hypothetical protein II825_02400 [Paludibacteraceae bacterium]|nr:hypothetical protein [Paludibacteraceae bacterium]